MQCFVVLRVGGPFTVQYAAVRVQGTNWSVPCRLSVHARAISHCDEPFGSRALCHLNATMFLLSCTFRENLGGLKITNGNVILRPTSTRRGNTGSLASAGVHECAQ